MPTPAEVARRANVSVGTVRNWSRDYAPLLSPAARGEDGPRLFDDDDVETICTIAVLRNTGMQPAEIIERIQADAAPPVVDAEATPPTDPPQAAPNALQSTALVLSSLQTAHNALQSDNAALQRRYERHLQRSLWSHGVAFYAGIVTMGAIFFVVWWLVNG